MDVCVNVWALRKNPTAVTNTLVRLAALLGSQTFYDHFVVHLFVVFPALLTCCCHLGQSVYATRLHSQALCYLFISTLLLLCLSRPIKTVGSAAVVEARSYAHHSAVIRVVTVAALILYSF